MAGKSININGEISIINGGINNGIISVISIMGNNGGVMKIINNVINVEIISNGVNNNGAIMAISMA
jgi:hypothetical protein